jgi:hypothetical protein
LEWLTSLSTLHLTAKLLTIEVGEPEESHEISWPAFQKLPTSLKTSIKDEKDFSATVIKSERPDGRQYQLPDKR